MIFQEYLCRIEKYRWKVKSQHTGKATRGCTWLLCFTRILLSYLHKPELCQYIYIY